MSASPAHARRQRSIGVVSALLLIPAILGVIGYKRRTEQSLSAGASPPNEAGALQSEASREPLALGVTNTNLYQYAGTMDVENRYTSTVMVSTDSRTTSARCSGVVISPRVVLTAASCLCEPSERPTPATGESLTGNSVSCLERAAVTTVIYGAVLDKEFPEDTTRMSFHGYEGTVRPHPAFKFVSGDAGPTWATHADLAVILLDEAVEDVAPEILMEQGEFQTHDPLIMAGYAHSGAKQAEGRVLYQQHGPFIYDGYAGGPCFREDSHRRLLVGIAGIGSDQELSFTSVSPFLDWVQAEVSQTVSPAPPASNH